MTIPETSRRSIPPVSCSKASRATASARGKGSTDGVITDTPARSFITMSDGCGAISVPGRKVPNGVSQAPHPVRTTVGAGRSAAGAPDRHSPAIMPRGCLTNGSRAPADWPTRAARRTVLRGRLRRSTLGTWMLTPPPPAARPSAMSTPGCSTWTTPSIRRATTYSSWSMRASAGSSPTCSTSTRPPRGACRRTIFANTAPRCAG